MFKKVFNALFSKSDNNIKTDYHQAEIKVDSKCVSENLINDYNQAITEQEISLSEKEINEFVQQEISNRISFPSFDRNENDSLLIDAARIVVSTQQGSTSMIQRQLKLGYNRAGRIMDQLESAGIVGVFNGAQARKVLVNNLLELEDFFLTSLYFDGKKRRLFIHEILPSKLEFIERNVEDYHKKINDQQEEDFKESIRQEILEEEQKRLEIVKRKNLKKELIKELAEKGLIKNESFYKREPIPQEVQDKVWNRDEGKCVNCGSQKFLEFDHIIPFSKGGSNTYRNLQLLCETCNRKKSNKIG